MPDTGSRSPSNHIVPQTRGLVPAIHGGDPLEEGLRRGPLDLDALHVGFGLGRVLEKLNLFVEHGDGGGLGEVKYHQRPISGDLIPFQGGRVKENFLGSLDIGPNQFNIFSRYVGEFEGSKLGLQVDQSLLGPVTNPGEN